MEGLEERLGIAMPAVTQCEMVAEFVFFFSSRRRHTRSKRDWSSDVCSSDLEKKLGRARLEELGQQMQRVVEANQRRSEERRVGKGVDVGGRRVSKKKKRGARRVPKGGDAG